MKFNLSERVKSILSCPFCGSQLKYKENGYSCNICQTQYNYSKSGSIDLRLKQVKTIRLNFRVGNSLKKTSVNESFLSINPHSEIDISDMKVPRHLTKELISYFPKPKIKNSMMLDLGCGNMIHKEICEKIGFEYVGLDYYSTQAPILGDAHSLPFNDESFEFILSIAVLEHLRFPFIAMQEAFRALKRGGMFIGTVAFLEPFHDNSYYHHTYLGILNSLLYGGFEIDKIAPNSKWSVLMALASMGFFPKMPKRISRSLIFPLEIFHRLWWKVGGLMKGYAIENKRMLHSAGSFFFIARKKKME